MKTPMQELIERLECLIGLSEGTKYEKGLKYAKEKAESMLEKEKEVIIKAAALQCYPTYEDAMMYAEQYYNETFNTKEK